MLAWICFFLLFCGGICAVVTGNLPTVSRTMLETPAQVVTLLLKIGGSICLFSGLMRVAEASGLVGLFSRWMSPLIGFLVPKTKRDGEVASAVSLNVASNFFGLGNAATPYGIRAASRLARTGEMSRSLASFLILNTCSLQLIPTTVCVLREACGDGGASDIFFEVWTVQICSCAVGILLVRTFFRRDP